MEREFKQKGGLKWFVTVQVRLVKYMPDGEDQFSTPHFRSNCQRLINLSEVSIQYQECVEKVKESFQTYQREKSSWQLQEVIYLLFLYVLETSEISFRRHFTQ